MNIRTYLVNCISNNTNIVKERYDFEYAGVCGYSELIGWKIIFFRRKKTEWEKAYTKNNIERFRTSRQF